MSSLYWRKFGIELEFSSDFDDINEISFPIINQIYGRNKFYVSKSHYKSDNNKLWHLKTDSSTECELVTPVSFYNDMPKIKKVIKKIAEEKVKITQRDGMHIHMQSLKNMHDNIILAWLQIESVFIKCFPKHRRNNYYCEKITNGRTCEIKKIYEKVKAACDDHHAAISLEKYDDRKTVEFRLSEMTIDSDIIENWIKFYMIFLNYAEHIKFDRVLNTKLDGVVDIKGLISLLHIGNHKICNFLNKRFSGDFKGN